VSEPKTIPTDHPIADFLAAILDQARRADSEALCALLHEITGEPPVIWGASMVGFGSQHFRYASGREGDWPRVAFSPRKQSLTLYLSGGFDHQQDLLALLGLHKIGKGCLHLKRPADADPAILRRLIERSLANPTA
jgi:hypothetical protein